VVFQDVKNKHLHISDLNKKFHSTIYIRKNNIQNNLFDKIIIICSKWIKNVWEETNDKKTYQLCIPEVFFIKYLKNILKAHYKFWI